jgi:hypothetical protein
MLAEEMHPRASHLFHTLTKLQAEANDALEGLVLDFFLQDEVRELRLAPQGDADPQQHDYNAKSNGKAGDGDGETKRDREEKDEQGEAAALEFVFQFSQSDIASGCTSKDVAKVIAQSAHGRRRRGINGWSEYFRTHEG